MGRFWICGHDGTTVPVAETRRLTFAVPPDHPLADVLPELPTPLAFSVAEWIAEPNPYIALHRLTDTAEIITRFFTIVLLSDLLRQRGQFPDAVRDALMEKIERPTFGAWRELLRIAFENLPQRKGKAHCFVVELSEFVRQRWIPALGGGEDEPEKAIIALRNLIAHSARLPNEQARRLLEAHQQRFEGLIRALAFLAGYDLIACTTDGRCLWLKGLPASDGSFPPFERPLLFEVQPERVYLVRGGEGLDLFPLHAFTDVLQWREEQFERIAEPAPQIYFRLNDKGYLEFVPFSERAALSHLKGSAYRRFRELFRLEEWRAQRRREAEAKGQIARFNELIAELTEVFVGREAQVRHVKERIKQTAWGVLWISGRPGVGKSALMASLTKDYRRQPHWLVIPYFFRFGQVGCSTGEFLNVVLKQIQAELGKAIEPAPSLEGRKRQFVEAVRELAGRPGKKVLFLVDGLDEVYRREREFLSLPFLAQAEGVIWVCAGRNEADLENELRRRGAVWVFEEELPGLDETAVRMMLTEHLGRLRYALLERDDEEGRNRFVAVVARKSQGLPLYVRMVIEDLKAGRWTIDDEDKLPEGLSEYFEMILERLRVSDVGTVLTPLFCLLAWAKEPVTEGGMRRLMSAHHLSRLPQWEESFRRAFEHGHIMLQRRPTVEGEAGWTIYHDSFRQYLLTTEAVRDNREWAHGRWLEVCSRWQGLQQEEPSLYRYTLRNYAEHLLEAFALASRTDHLARLYALARDEAFYSAQRQAFIQDPDLPLMTVQAALQGAMESDDAEAMASFCLAQAWRVLDITRELPLAALRRTDSIERAWRLADLYGAESCTLWHLILAWELKDRDRMEAAEETLERLLKKDLPRLSGWQGECAAVLLGQMPEISEDAFNRLQERLLGDDAHRRILCVELLKRGRFASAMKSVELILDKEERVRMLCLIARVQAAVRKRAQARETLTAAMEIAKGIRDEWKRAWALARIAEAQAKLGDFEAAWRTANGIKYEGMHAHALCEIARAQAAMGERDRAREILAVAIETAKEIEYARSRAITLCEIAKAQDEVGERDLARETLMAAAEAAKESKDDGTLDEVAQAQAGVGDFQAAIQTAREIVEEWSRGHTLREIAKAQVRAGDFRAAMRTVKETGDEEWQVEVVGEIAKAKARAGDFKIAIKIAMGIRSEWVRARVLYELAEWQIEAGEMDQAKETLSAAIEAAEGLKYVREELLSKIAQAQARAGDLEAAVETARRIGPRALCEIAALQVEAGEMDRAREIFATAIEAAGETDREWLRAKALGDVAKAQAEAGDFKGAMDTVKGLENAWFRAITVLEIAQGQIEKGAIDQLQEIMTTAIKAAQEIEDPSKRAEAFWKIAEVQVGAGKRNRARETFAVAIQAAREIEDEELRKEVLGEVARAQIRVRDFRAAIETAKQIEHEWLREEILYEVAEAQVSAGDCKAAIETVKEIENEVWRKVALDEVTRAHLRAEDLQAALEVAKEIGDEKLFGEILGKMARARLEAGDFDAAIEVARAALEVAKEIGDEELFGEIIGEMARARLEAGDFDAAIEVARQIADEWLRQRILKQVVEAQARAGDFRAAMETAKEIEDKGWYAETLIEVAKAQIEVGEMDLARETLQAIITILKGDKEIQERAIMLCDVAEIQVKAGEMDGARETIAAALQAAEETGLKSVLVGILCGIAEAQIKAGGMDQANETIAAAIRIAKETGTWLLGFDDMVRVHIRMGDFKAAVEVAREIGSGKERVEAFFEIAEAQARAGETDQAKETLAAAVEAAKEIEEMKERVRALGEIAEAQLKLGDFQAALRTAREIEDEEQRVRILCEIAKAQAKAGLGEEAVRTTREIIIERNRRLPEIASALVEVGDKENFKRLLPPCAYYLDAAYQMCGLLARLYPNQASAIARILKTQ